MYVAKTYVRLGRKLVVPGEILDDVPEENRTWLIKAGAIEQIESVAPVSSEPESVDEPEDTSIDETESVDVPEIDVMEGIVQETEKKPKPARRRTKK